MRCEGIPSKQPPERHAKNVAGVEAAQRRGRVLPPDERDSSRMRFHGDPWDSMGSQEIPWDSMKLHEGHEIS